LQRNETWSATSLNSGASVIVITCKSPTVKHARAKIILFADDTSILITEENEPLKHTIENVVENMLQQSS
jgi:ribosomal protein L14